MARAALLFLMVALATPGVSHRFDPTDMSKARAAALLGYAPADICGGESDGATAGHICDACLFAAGLAMPPRCDVAAAPDLAAAVHALPRAAAFCGAPHARYRFARAPPEGPVV